MRRVFNWLHGLTRPLKGPEHTVIRAICLAATVFVLTWGGYVSALAWWARVGKIDWNLAAAWAQVATAFSFAGAGLVALIGVAEQLRPKSPKLQVHWGELEIGGAVVFLKNRGDAAAGNVVVRVEVGPTICRPSGWSDFSLMEFPRRKNRVALRFEVRPQLDQGWARELRFYPSPYTRDHWVTRISLRAPLPAGEEVLVCELGPLPLGTRIEVSTRTFLNYHGIEQMVVGEFGSLNPSFD